MIFWVGVTDKGWFDHLAALQPDEVNFWQPSASPPTKQLKPGDLFLFKLHAPLNYIVGGGYFVRFTSLPTRLAWEAFGERNGVASHDELIARLDKYRGGPGNGDSVIGSNILNAPFFFPEEHWIPIPPDWKRNIVRGKTYSTDTTEGANLYSAVREKLAFVSAASASGDIQEEVERYGNEYLVRARLGQGAFRILVTDAYHRRCAVTAERTLPVLEAAHIRLFAAEGPNTVSNGLLLRADIHRLFDSGYVTLDRDLKFVVSARVREEYENGREYYAYHGRRLGNLPDAVRDQPTREFIDWHNERIYVG